MTPTKRAVFAGRDLGGVEQTKAAIRNVRTTGLETLGSDTRYAARTLGHARGFTAVAVARSWDRGKHGHLLDSQQPPAQDVPRS
jgi:hypothetical protein